VSGARLAALAAAGAVALAGCGSSGSSGSSGALSKRAYIAKADHICAQGEHEVKPYTTQLDRLTAGGDPQQIFAKAPALIRQATAHTQKLLDRLAALPAPKADAADISRWLGRLRTEQHLLDESASAFERRDAKSIHSLGAQLSSIDAAANAFARSYGMHACATSTG
jgi:hypothetical protein